MEEDASRPHGIALILELKEAQNALYDHMQEEHLLIAPWISIWNGDPNGHVWPQYDSFLVLCSPVSLFNRILGAKGGGKDVRHKIYDELHAGSPWQLFLLSSDLDEIAEDPESTLRIILMSGKPSREEAREARSRQKGAGVRAGSPL